MALIKATDLAWGRLRAPDLDAAEEFLTNFGMVRADRTSSALYMRGTDAPHHLHVTEKGDPGFIGLAFYAASLADPGWPAAVPCHLAKLTYTAAKSLLKASTSGYSAARPSQTSMNSRRVRSARAGSRGMAE